MTYSGPSHPRILQVGEAWGTEEYKARKPFVGASGQENWRMWGQAFADLWPEEHARVSALFDPHSQTFCGPMWILQREQWLHEASIGFTNVFNLQPPISNAVENLCCKKTELAPLLENMLMKEKDIGRNYPFPALTRGLYLRPEYFPELDRLRAEIMSLEPTLIVSSGNTACWALLGTTNIGSIRGTITNTSPSAPAKPPPVKVLPTYHPASVLYQWPLRPTVIIDYIKAVRESKFPEVRRPARQILINPTLTEVKEWVLETVLNPPKWLACDTETTAGHIDTISFARSPWDALVIPFHLHRYRRGTSYIYVKPVRDGQEVASYWTQAEEETVRQLIQELLTHPVPKLFQNGLYDLQYLWREGYTLDANHKAHPVGNPAAPLLLHPAKKLLPWEDSMLAHHSLYPELPKGLGFLGSIYTDEPAWKLMRTHQGDTEKRDE